MTVVADARRDGDIMHLPDFFRVEHEGQALLQLGELCAGRKFSIQDLDMRPGDAGPNSDMRGMHLHLKGRRGIELLAQD